MLRLQRTRKFERDYAALPERIKDAADRKLRLFAEAPRHPSLRLKRVGGSVALWEISINMQYRVTLSFPEENLALLERIGTHSVLDQP